MSDGQPLYNSRIAKMYLEYLRLHHPDIEPASVLEMAGIAPYQVEDPAHWFTQEEVDLLHSILVRETGESEISRNVGRFATSAKGLGAVKQYILGLMTPTTLYQFMEKNYSLLSRGAIISARKLGPNSVEITSTPKPGAAEKPYQCANRTGIFESLSHWFTGEPATIDHPECFHRGDDHCRYIVTWHQSGSSSWRRIRNISMSIGLLAVVGCFGFMPLTTWGLLVLSLTILTLACAWQSERLEKLHLAETVVDQKKAAEETLLESELRYNNAMLIQEMGQAISNILKIDRLLVTVMGIIEKRLNFDRGLIMLANPEKTALNFITGYGHAPEEEEYLRSTPFNMTNPQSKGVFILAMRERRPFLVENIQAIENDLSPKSIEFARRLGSDSLICVPIVYEKEALGILVVDNSRSKRPLNQSDLSLLIGVASQLATSIVNAMSFERVRESEKKYRDLVQTGSSLILRVDKGGRITFVNEFAQQLLGYSEAELLGHLGVDFILPEAAAGLYRFEDFIAAMSREPQRPTVRESQTRLRSGAISWIAWTYRPIYDEGGSFHELLCIGNDITELKRADQEKRELQDKLQRAKKMEAIGTLAGGVAHDLNNILTGIVSYPELLLLDIPEDSPLRKPILTIKKSGEKAAAIVQDLLTLARRGVDTTAVVNLNQIVNDYLASPEFAKLEAYHPGLIVNSRLDDQLLNILGSPVHLSKTIMNLVSNAAEAMPDGGTIALYTENRHLEEHNIGFEEPLSGDFVVVRVLDAGIGISPEDMERIFEPFYTKKTMGRSGTGLGMAVVWGTVKDHRGHIELKSQVGQGTEVTLYFPATRRQAPNRLEQQPLSAILGRGEKVLVVDDVLEQRDIAAEILRKLGYTATLADSGEKALELLKTQEADLVVLDMIMNPGMDGLETFKRICQLRPGQKTIIVSGFSESTRVREAQRLGAGAYIKKPYLLQTFGRAIRHALEQP